MAQAHGAPQFEPLDGHQEVRCAVRFPLALKASLRVGGYELAGRTRDISASGVLFELDKPLETGETIEFSLCMSGKMLGTSHDVLVCCTGRVVRCSLSHGQHLAAATIDEYQFAKQQ